MTRKHFIQVADAIKDNIRIDREGRRSFVEAGGLIEDLCVAFKRINSNFDTTKFINYIAEEK